MFFLEFKNYELLVMKDIEKGNILKARFRVINILNFLKVDREFLGFMYS